MYVENNGGGNLDCGTETWNTTVVFYYSPNGGDDYHTWVNDENNGDGNFQIDCNVDGEPELTVDFTSESTNLTYKDYRDLNIKNDLQADPDTDGFNDTVTFSEHSDDNASITYPDDRNQEPAELPVNHYFAMADDMDMEVWEQNNANIGDDSQGVIQYEGNGEVVTFLHVTDNRIRVELD
jgi:hypothetical protein